MHQMWTWHTSVADGSSDDGSDDGDNDDSGRWQHCSIDGSRSWAANTDDWQGSPVMEGGDGVRMADEAAVAQRTNGQFTRSRQTLAPVGHDPARRCYWPWIGGRHDGGMMTRCVCRRVQDGRMDGLV
jgi:hypothetical protein